MGHTNYGAPCQFLQPVCIVRCFGTNRCREFLIVDQTSPFHAAPIGSNHLKKGLGFTLDLLNIVIGDFFFFGDGF